RLEVVGSHRVLVEGVLRVTLQAALKGLQFVNVLHLATFVDALIEGVPKVDEFRDISIELKFAQIWLIFNDQNLGLRRWRGEPHWWHIMPVSPVGIWVASARWASGWTPWVRWPAWWTSASISSSSSEASASWSSPPGGAAARWPSSSCRWV